jgi:hypothetical protein
MLQDSNFLEKIDSIPMMVMAEAVAATAAATAAATQMGMIHSSQRQSTLLSRFQFCQH